VEAPTSNIEKKVYSTGTKNINIDAGHQERKPRNIKHLVLGVRKKETGKCPRF